uniref:Uncharacterized protein n=1 Tax=Haemonchus contortus TaxID=6289 RepID=A0A7I4YK85_HAECO
MALSFYQQHCIHATLSSVAEAGNVALAHPPRSRWDPTNMAVVTDMARSYASSYPWTDSSWKNLKLRKNLIILPAGFENVLDCFKSELQRAVIMKKPEDMEPDWFTDDYSSVLLFSPAEFAGTSRWRGAWTLLMQLVAKGTEVIALAGPQNDSQWKKSVDMLRDLFEETLYQRPSLKNRLRCLLPLRSQQETVGAGFSTVTYENGKIFTQSAAKRFWMTTMAQYASLLKFTPFKRMDERRTGGVPNTQGYQQKVAPWKGQQRRGGHHPKTGGRTPQEIMPLQRIGNKMFKLVPVQREHRYAGHSGPRGRGGRGSNPHRRF